jgi:hypothetical protein
LTFFSTDVVKYQRDGDGPTDYYYTSYSGLALERWIGVSIPLTIITFAVTIGWYYFYEPTMNAARGWLRASLRWNHRIQGSIHEKIYSLVVHVLLQ